MTLCANPAMRLAAFACVDAKFQAPSPKLTMISSLEPVTGLVV